MSADGSFPPQLLADIQRDWMLQDYGRALIRMEEHWKAAPQDPWRRLHYATILGHCSRFRAAQPLLDALVADARAEQRLWALGSAGVACADFRRFDWAADYMREAAAEPAAPAEVFYRWADALERLNRLTEANAAAAEGRSRYPGHAGLALLAARMARRSDAPDEAERLARNVIASGAPMEVKCQAGYELGHALDAQDRCAEAYAAFLAAKEIQRPQASAYESIWRTRAERMRSGEDLPTAADFRHWAAAAPSPPRRHAFVVGCPRSGTTLLERMLGSHPHVAATSESTVWLSAVWMPFLRACDENRIFGMRNALSTMTPHQFNAGREGYWRHIGETTECEAGRRLLLDKNPSIFSVLPGAVRFFPEARMLVALRDPPDIVWSCFTQYLPVNPVTAAFASLDAAAEQTAAELEQWLHLRDRLATPWLEVRYESVAQDGERELRRITSFLDLPWRRALLAFHERTDKIGSPSYAQAAQPVHPNAVGRWRRYAGLFQPLEAKLSRVIREME